MRLGRRLAALLGLVVVLASCGPSGPQGAHSASRPTPSGPSRLVAAILSDPKALGIEAGSAPGAEALRGLLHAGLANPDEQDQVRAQLAEAVPTIENGLWRLLADGRMETTWRIRAGAAWHDGTPFTSDDLLFTSQVARDPELAAFRDAAYRSVEGIDAPDERTVVVRWAEPHVDADQLFGNPLPRHLVGEAAQNDKANFTQLPYWSQAFVGTGPFKLREWVPGDHVLVEANDSYVLGRPKIDEIEVRLILESSTLIANLLSGTVELPIGRTLSLDQALAVRDRWQTGHVDVVARPGWLVIYPQLAYTSPPIVGNVRFRRALLQAIDRQEQVDTLAYGLSSVADTMLAPNRPEYAEIKARAPHTPYDPSAAQQTIRELGYVQAGDGRFVDDEGQALEVEIRTTGDNDANVKTLYSVVDYWQRIGVGVQPVLIPPQKQADREYRATFPGFGLYRHPNDVSFLINFTSGRVPTRDNNWTGGVPGYRDSTFDALYAQYTRTIPQQERIDVLGQLISQLDDQAVTMGLYYDSLAALIGNRVQNVVVPQQYGAQYVWSAHFWELRERASPRP